MNTEIKVTVDCVVFDQNGRLLLVRRKNPPYQGAYALPGGFVKRDETTEAAAARELKEETGLTAKHARLVGVYSDPARDPRGRVITIAYLVSVEAENVTAGDDAASAEFVADWGRLPLAFDHARIIADALKIKVI